jgi:hypothetical protein
MKKNFSFLTGAAIALSLALGISTANAAWTTGHSLVTVLTTADSSKLAAVKGGTADPVYTLGAAEGLTANDTVRIDLTGGAVWAAIPTLTPSAGDLGAGATTAATPLTGGQIGDTYATWRAIDALVVATSTLTLNSFTAADFDVTGVVAGGNVDMTMTLTTSTNLPIGSVQSHQATVAIGNYLFTGSAAETVALTAKTDTADVEADTGVYTKFVSDTLNGTATVLSYTNDSGAATVPASLAIAAKKVLLTLEGDFTGIASVSATGFTGSDSAGLQTGGTADFFLINAEKTMAYASNTASLAAAGVLAAAPTFVLDGTSVQSARIFRATVAVLAETGNWAAHEAKSSTALSTIARNGAQFIAPHLISRDGWESYLVFKATSTSEAANMIIDVFNKAGETATVNLTLPAAAAGAQTTISAADILADAGLLATGADSDFSATVTITLPQTEVFVDGFKYGAGATYPTAVYENKDFSGQVFAK